MRKLTDLKTEASFAIKPKTEVPHGTIAKKDFVIHQNEHHYEIKAGDDVSDIPKHFHQNLKTEGVL